MISKELETEVLRLFHVESWRVGTIAKYFALHHSTVSRIVNKSREPVLVKAKTSQIDHFKPFIKETLDLYHDLTSMRLYEMLVSRGYKGKIGLVRLAARELRGRKTPEAFLKLRTLAGEQAQVDWAHFGHLEIGQARRSLMAFVMVLSYSRAIYCHYFLSQCLGNFIQGHELAFNWFGGVPRVCLYDNLKSLVIERAGKAIKFNESFLDYAAYHHFQPLPVAVRRGNEKGRVERAIRYIRESFFAARDFKDLNDLNEQALHWCNTISLDRKWPQNESMTIRKAFNEEKPLLMTLAGNPYPTEERKEVVVGKTPYVQFDLNCYSVPYTAVRKTLVVLASSTRVRILDKQEEIASHNRSFDRNQQIEDPAHVQELVRRKARATEHRNTNSLISSIPSAEDLLNLAASRRLSMRTITKQLLNYLTLYGAEELDIAFKEAIAKNTPHPNSIKRILERNRLNQGRPLPLSNPIKDNSRAQNITVEVNSLKSYDILTTITVKDEDHEE